MAMSPKKDDLMAFAARMREARKNAGYTIMDVSAATGINKNTISNVETGRSGGTLIVVAAMAELYGANLDWLVLGRG